MVEMEEQRETHIMKRGDYQNIGLEVEPGTPAILHASDPKAPKNRLGFAQWLVSSDNPLVARVTVNRWWAELMGQGIVPTLEDFGTQSDPPSHPKLLDWLAMEFIDGDTLLQWLTHPGRADATTRIRLAASLLAKVCDAVVAAHQRGVIHRDLKPDNILVDEHGQPHILDFGLAKVTEREMRPGSLVLTREGMIFGTPEFMSPEQARGRTLDARSDIYSLGLIFYELAMVLQQEQQPVL